MANPITDDTFKALKPGIPIPHSSPPRTIETCLMCANWNHAGRRKTTIGDDPGLGPDQLIATCSDDATESVGDYSCGCWNLHQDVDSNAYGSLMEPCRVCARPVGTTKSCAACLMFRSEAEKIKDRLFGSPRFVDALKKGR